MGIDWTALFWAAIFTALIHCLVVAVWLNLKVNSPDFGKPTEKPDGHD